MLAATGWIDPNRIAIYAGVDLYGISNWQRTMENVPVYWGARRAEIIQEMGDPEKDAEYFRRRESQKRAYEAVLAFLDRYLKAPLTRPGGKSGPADP